MSTNVPHLLLKVNHKEHHRKKPHNSHTLIRDGVLTIAFYFNAPADSTTVVVQVHPIYTLIILVSATGCLLADIVAKTRLRQLFFHP